MPGTDLASCRSPLHAAIDGAVDGSCVIACKVSEAEKHLRSGNHAKAGKALEEAVRAMQECQPILQIALWECAKRAKHGKIRLRKPGPDSLPGSQPRPAIALMPPIPRGGTA